MPTLMAGSGFNGDDPIVVDISDERASQLGLPPVEEPKPLGCGSQGCAYLTEDGEHVVKITRDPQDAVNAYMVMNLPPESAEFAIPVYDIQRLAVTDNPESDLWIIVTAKADTDMPKALGKAFNDIYKNFGDNKITANQWDNFVDVTLANIDDEEAEEGETEHTSAWREALGYADNAVRNFRKLGIFWWDFHRGNWGIHDGKLKVIDFGMSLPLEAPPIKRMAAERKPPKLKPEDVTALRRVVGYDGHRIFKTSATRLERAGLVWVIPNSEHRKSNFGKEEGPWYVTAVPTSTSQQFLDDAGLTPLVYRAAPMG